MTNYSSKQPSEIPYFYHPSSEDRRLESRKTSLSSSGGSMTSSLLSYSTTMGPTSAPNNTQQQQQQSQQHNNHSPRSSSSSASHRSPPQAQLPSSVPFSPPYSSPQQLFQSLAAASSNAAAAAAAAKRTRHRVDAGEPRGCFQQNFYSSYESKMLTDYNQQLLRDMLVSKIGFEEDVKVRGSQKRKLCQPVKNENPPREGASPGPPPTMLSNNNNNHRREHSITPTPPMTNGNSWGSHPLPPHLRSTPLQQQLQHPLSPPPFPLHQIPYQWKETFKSNILATIGDLIDAQFAALHQLKEGSILGIPLPLPQPQHQPQRSVQHHPPPQVPIPPPQPPPPPRNFFPSVGLRQPPAGLSPTYPHSADSPLSLVMTPNTKKKRHKVTDTRLTPRNVLKLDEDEKYFGKYDVSPPASLNDFVNSQMDDQGSDDTELSGGNEGTIRSSDGASPWSTNGGISSTLTPMHLRKAKLMFFWVRYPSSSVLKMYFPDIKFNKNNTAQLVKWFSNFREFYYIQMEKYARAALAEGVKSSDDIHITIDSELYRLLNLHYNRNNHIEVPSNFRYVVEQTLREFFKAIQNRKDAEQSWKKTIYKIIARLDDPVPENFKRAEFLETLE